VGIESLNTREAATQHKLLVQHVNKLRLLPALARAQMVIGLESNLGFEAQHALHALRRAEVHNWVSLMEGVDGTPGLLTTNASKEVMCVALQELLAQSRIGVSNRLMSTSMSPHEALQQLIGELRGFMIFVDPPKTLFAKARRTFTGKLGGHQDDLVIALQLAVVTMQMFDRHDKYRKFH
jgi:hypothetical protein